MTALAAHRVAQDRERLANGDAWPREHDGLVFRSTYGTPLDGKNMNRTLRDWLASAGIDKPGFRVYDIRHTFASHRADAGAPLTRLADYMGNDPQTLEKYYRRPVTPVLDIAADTPAAATL